MYECYDNIVGLASSNCECMQADRPDGYDVSASGLYLDELANVKALLGAPTCGKTTWEVLEACRATAVKRLVAESNALLGKHYALRRQPLKAQVIGKIKAKDTLSPTKNYAVRRIACNPIRGGFMKINSLGAIFSATGSTTIALYNNVDGFIENFELDTLANKHKATAINKTYPLFSKYVDCLEYYLVTEYDEDNLPKDNEVSCGCGSNNFYFDLGNPYYSGIDSFKNVYWPNFVMVGSVSINSLTQLDSLPAAASNKMLGLTIDADFGCKVNEVLCEDSLDFVGNPLALSLAFCVLYGSGVELADKILNSGTFSPETLANRDEWETNKDNWQEKYNEHLTFLIPRVNITTNDCFTCKDLIGMTRQGLFA